MRFTAIFPVFIFLKLNSFSDYFCCKILPLLEFSFSMLWVMYVHPFPIWAQVSPDYCAFWSWDEAFFFWTPPLLEECPLYPEKRKCQSRWLCFIHRTTQQLTTLRAGSQDSVAWSWPRSSRWRLRWTFSETWSSPSQHEGLFLEEGNKAQ